MIETHPAYVILSRIATERAISPEALAAADQASLAELIDQDQISEKTETRRCQLHKSYATDHFMAQLKDRLIRDRRAGLAEEKRQRLTSLLATRAEFSQAAMITEKNGGEYTIVVRV